MQNRILKFRVWDNISKKYINTKEFRRENKQNNIVGEVLIDTDGKIRVAEYPCGNGDNAANSVFDEWASQNDFVIEQFTGITDKTGKEIYEGDIVSFMKDDGVVKFSDGIYFVDWLWKDNDDEDILGLLNIGMIKVSGNIHENPELL
jgi:uncharacterized phage protein (TIGR01671 family)